MQKSRLFFKNPLTSAVPYGMIQSVILKRRDNHCEAQRIFRYVEDVGHDDVHARDVVRPKKVIIRPTDYIHSFMKAVRCADCLIFAKGREEYDTPLSARDRLHQPEQPANVSDCFLHVVHTNHLS